MAAFLFRLFRRQSAALALGCRARFPVQQVENSAGGLGVLGRAFANVRVYVAGEVPASTGFGRAVPPRLRFRGRPSAFKPIFDLTEMEIAIDGKRYMFRSDAKGTTGKFFQACGVALPPTILSSGHCRGWA